MRVEEVCGGAGGLAHLSAERYNSGMMPTACFRVVVEASNQKGRPDMYMI